MSEVSTKIEKLRRVMQEYKIQVLSLKGVDWFSWATGGGRSSVIFTSEKGVAEVLITAKSAYIITSEIETKRLALEEVPHDYEIVSLPWAFPSSRDQFVQEQLGSEPCYSDHPLEDEIPIPQELERLKLILTPDEIDRYRLVSRLAAEAMTEALDQATPNWSENQLAGAGAKALWSRGLDPTLVLVGNHRRIQEYRHPVAGPEKLGDAAMMVFCARGFGLYANLTRFVFFRQPHTEELDRLAFCKTVEARLLSASVPGASLAELYQTAADAYKDLGHPDEIKKHHQGGITGYLSREHVATAESAKSLRLESGMALAWNPSFPGAKIEDTVLMTENGIEILTVDRLWPTSTFAGRERPEIWVKT